MKKNRKVLGLVILLMVALMATAVVPAEVQAKKATVKQMSKKKAYRQLATGKGLKVKGKKLKEGTTIQVSIANGKKASQVGWQFQKVTVNNKNLKVTAKNKTTLTFKLKGLKAGKSKVTVVLKNTNYKAWKKLVGNAKKKLTLTFPVSVIKKVKKPTAQVPTTQVPTTQVPTTQVPETPNPGTPAPETPNPEIPAPETPDPEKPTPTENPDPEKPDPEKPTPTENPDPVKTIEWDFGSWNGGWIEQDGVMSSYYDGTAKTLPEIVSNCPEDLTFEYTLISDYDGVVEEAIDSGDYELHVELINLPEGYVANDTFKTISFSILPREIFQYYLKFDEETNQVKAIVEGMVEEKDYEVEYTLDGVSMGSTPPVISTLGNHRVISELSLDERNYHLEGERRLSKNFEGRRRTSWGEVRIDTNCENGESTVVVYLEKIRFPLQKSRGYVFFNIGFDIETENFTDGKFNGDNDPELSLSNMSPLEGYSAMYRCDGEWDESHEPIKLGSWTYQMDDLDKASVFKISAMNFETVEQNNPFVYTNGGNTATVNSPEVLPEVVYVDTDLMEDTKFWSVNYTYTPEEEEFYKNSLRRYIENDFKGWYEILGQQ